MTTMGATEKHQLAGSLEELLAGAERREQMANPDGRSGSVFERVWIDGQPHVLKYLHPDDDFAMRAAGDVRVASVRAWAAGLLDAAPGLVDHAIVGAVTGLGRNHWGAALLMRDVSAELLPLDGALIPAEQHADFIDHVAGFCAATWGWRDGDAGVNLLPYSARWRFFSASALDAEAGLGWPERVPKVAREGWDRFAHRAPRDVAEPVLALVFDSTPLSDALALTPSCLIHGDIKASNAGCARDGRTVLIDWVYAGEGPVAHDVAWHLALDRDRLPASKEQVIDHFAAALVRHGVWIDGWWQRQMGLCLLGALVEFGWEKAYGDDDELGWWCEAARAGLALL